MNFGREIIKASEIIYKEPQWLMEPYIAYGKITFLYGERGKGTTKMAMHMMAQWQQSHANQNVLYMTSEERVDSIIISKMKKQKMSLEQTFIVNDGFPITLADDSIEDIINEHNIRFLVIDTIEDFIDADKDFYKKAKSVYPIILKLANIAERTNCAILLLHHLEADDGDPILNHWCKHFHSAIISYMSVFKGGCATQVLAMQCKSLLSECGPSLSTMDIIDEKSEESPGKLKKKY